MKSTYRANKLKTAIGFGIVGFTEVQPYMRHDATSVRENPAWDDARYEVEVTFKRLPKRKRK